MPLESSVLQEVRDLIFGAHRIPGRLADRLKRQLSFPPKPLDIPVPVEIESTLPAQAVRLQSLAECKAYFDESAELWARRTAFETSIVAPRRFFSLRGYCAACTQQTEFLVDFRFSDGKTPNWRERVNCVRCKLPNRVRGMLDFLQSLGLADSASIYVTEQSTPFFRALYRRYKNVVGSEFLVRGKKGAVNLLRIRNEDLTALSFADNSFDAICSADVLEHVPEYMRALAECYRCLRPGGAIVITVPFMLFSETTMVRAVIQQDGSTLHLEPPEYHGNPLTESGSLCYYHFGWDFLESLKQLGFKDASLNVYWSFERGYLGGIQLLISALKAITL